MSRPTLVLMAVVVVLVGILTFQDCGLWATVGAGLAIVPACALLMLGKALARWREKWKDHSR